MFDEQGSIGKCDDDMHGCENSAQNRRRQGQNGIVIDGAAAAREVELYFATKEEQNAMR